MPQADPLTFAIAEQHIRDLVAQLRARRTVTGQVVGRLKAAGRELHSQDELATALLATPRTLRRRLAEEGTSFRELADHVLAERAIALLKSGRTSVEQVAWSSATPGRPHSPTRSAGGPA